MLIGMTLVLPDDHQLRAILSNLPQNSWHRHATNDVDDKVFGLRRALQRLAILQRDPSLFLGRLCDFGIA
jgi:hypothetical protein